jgi:tRNA pseudouridine38-40 synthase
VAYDGSRYFGFVRQPGKPTVEDELLTTLKRCELYGELRKAWYRVAARTDRGVCALGQVVALDTFKEPDVAEINRFLPSDIAVLASKEVKKDFDPRSQAITKHYRYVHEMSDDLDTNQMKDAAKLLEGTHDFKCFCKREPNRPTVEKVIYAGVGVKNFLTFDFIAPVFLRQQVRRMVSALLAVGSGSMKIDDLKIAIEGRAEHSLKPAPSEGLFLVRVYYKRLPLRPRSDALERFVKYLGAKKDLRSREMRDQLQRFL